MSRIDELTIDQLAAAVGMTVRNVRAYATRGLLQPPRLVGRKGFYGVGHVARLRLIRDLINRGYTLGAVEKALEDHPEMPDTHALEMLGLLANPVGQGSEPEEVDIDTLARLAGVEDEPEVIERMGAALVERGLVEFLDDGRLRLLQPVLVRAGAQAIALGMSPETVLELFAEVRQDVAAIANQFVEAVRREVWRPFARRGMPEAEWPALIGSVEQLIPVAVQAVVAAFRHELSSAIETGVGKELSNLTGEQTQRIFGTP
jgi:DNA-binding transcriptional MerR regulator